MIIFSQVVCNLFLAHACSQSWKTLAYYWLPVSPTNIFLSIAESYLDTTCVLAVVVQSLSHVQIFATQQTAAHQAFLSFTIPRISSNSCPLNRWCHPTMSSSVIPFSSCLQSFPSSGSFPVSHLFVSGGQSIEATALASVLLMNIQGWFPLLTGLISLLSRGLKESSPAPHLKASIFWHSVQLSHPYTTTGKTIALTIQTFIGKVNSLLFNMISRLVIAFLPRSKHLLISRL